VTTSFLALLIVARQLLKGAATPVSGKILKSSYGKKSGLEKSPDRFSTMGVQIGIPIKSIIGSHIKATEELKIVARIL